MLLFLLIYGSVFIQPPDSLQDVIVWTFDSPIWDDSTLNAASYVNPQYCKRAWFKYGCIPYNYFCDPQYELWRIPPALNEKGAWFEGGVQVSELWAEAGWPCDNPYDTTHSPHQPPYKIPDPVFDDFATRDADGNIYWKPAPFFCPVTFVSIANENLQDYVLYWAMEQVDANVNAIEFDVINGGGHGFNVNGKPGNNPNTGYDDYHLGTANFATKISVVFGHGTEKPQWFYPEPSASSEVNPAKYAFDDDRSTFWRSEKGDSHWIEIDFKRKRKVHQIYLWLHKSHILKNFSINYWDDGWRDFSPPIDVENNTKITRSFLVEPVYTSKIRLFSADDEVYLPELQVFGTGFRQYLLKRYCEDSSWTVDDERWESIKLVELSDTLQCPDGTMNTFNYREYLKAHNWTGNPFGGPLTPENIFNPYNPLFFDWFPTKYWWLILVHFFDDPMVIDSITNLYTRSYLYQDLLSFWELISDSVKSYAFHKGKRIYVTHNGSARNLPFKCDYLMRGIFRGELFPAYPAPSPTDSLKLHLDGTQAQINCWRLWRKFALSGHPDNPPIVVFPDFGFGDFPFHSLGGRDEPADERAEYLRTYVWEIYASGLRFCLPVKISTLNAWKDTTSDGTRLIDVIKKIADFLHRYKDIYGDTVINKKEGDVKVNGIVPFNGEWNIVNGWNDSPVNESKVTIAYIDSKDGSKSYLHIINHNWDDINHRMMPQKDVEVEIPVRDEPLLIRLASPDFEKEDTLSFDYENKRVTLKIPELRYYAVLIIEFPGPGVEEEPSKLNISYSLGKSVKFFYELPSKGKMGIKIYDKTGRVVRKLLDGIQDRGYHEIVWDGKDDGGREVCSGIYFVIFKYKELTLKKKIVKLNRR